jgi:hypothetical protein
MKSLTFKIKHGRWSADLQLPAESTLESLAFAIIDALGFDMDHPFGFYDNLKKPYRSEEEYTVFADMGQPSNEDDTGVTETPIEDVFEPGKKMLFFFDYGDEWMFPVACTGAVEGEAFKQSKLLATTGKPPTQYPDSEDE